MRRIDAWAGVAVCLALTALRKLGDLRRAARRRPAEITRILFVKPAEQGATVLAYPAIRWAVRQVGRENVYFLVFEENRLILDVMEIVPPENVITIPTRGLLRLLAGTFRALRRIRRLRIDATVDLEFFARASAALTYLSGAPVRVGLHRFDDAAPYRGDLMTHRFRYDPAVHISQLFESMARAILLSPEDLSGATLDAPPVDSTLPTFAPRPEELAGVKAMLADHVRGRAYSPLVLLNANASDILPVRRWPSERYVELARRLVERSAAVHVAFTGAPNEAEHARRLAAAVASERCFSLAGKTTLRELLVLYCLADVLVTNDSGPAHFASLTPIRSAVLFGPEMPARFGSMSPRSHIFWAHLACSPCVTAYNNRLSRCRDNVCMKRITVDEVLEKVCEICGLPGKGPVSA